MWQHPNWIILKFGPHGSLIFNYVFQIFIFFKLESIRTVEKKYLNCRKGHTNIIILQETGIIFSKTQKYKQTLLEIMHTVCNGLAKSSYKHYS